MKVHGAVSIHRTQSNQGPDVMNLVLRDDNSRTNFAEVSMTLEAFALAVTGLGCQPCEIEVDGLERVGMVKETRTHEFVLGCEVYDQGCKALAWQEAQRTCPEGWTPCNSFNSHSSFFTKGDQTWARCTIRRYVAQEGAGE